MDTNHIKTVFENYISDESENFAILLNGSWGSGKTFFWENDLKPIALSAGKKILYISLNGINSRESLEHLMFIRMLPFFSQSENKRKTQLALLLGNVAGMITKKKWNVSLPEVFKGLSLDTIIYSEYAICFDDFERCQVPLPQLLGFINDFVEHKKLKTVILSDETKVDQSQTNYASIKEKVIGRTFNFHLDQDDILPRLLEKYKVDERLFLFLKLKETYFKSLFRSFKEDNLRIITFCLSVIEKLYFIMWDQKDESINDAIFCALAISIDLKRGFLDSNDEGDFKELNMLTVVQQFWAQPGSDLDMTISEIIKSPYPKGFFMRYLKDSSKQFVLFRSIFNFVVSGYLDENELKEEFFNRDPDNVPEYQICFPLIVNYNFRNLNDDEFKELVQKTMNYAEEGLYSIYNYLQIADFYFYFSDNGLIDLNYDQILSFVRTGLSKAANRKEIDSEAFGNILRFKKDNSETEKFKDEISMIHSTLIREKRQDLMLLLSNNIRKGNTDEITKTFNDNRFDKDFLPGKSIEELNNAITAAPNKSIAQLIIIFHDRYSPANIGNFLPEDCPSLKAISNNLKTILTDPKLGQPRKFLLGEFIQVISAGIANIEKSTKAAVS